MAQFGELVGRGQSERFMKCKFVGEYWSLPTNCAGSGELVNEFSSFCPRANIYTTYVGAQKINTGMEAYK